MTGKRQAGGKAPRRFRRAREQSLLREAKRIANLARKAARSDSQAYEEKLEKLAWEHILSVRDEVFLKAFELLGDDEIASEILDDILAKLSERCELEMQEGESVTACLFGIPLTVAEEAGAQCESLPPELLEALHETFRRHKLPHENVSVVIYGRFLDAIQVDLPPSRRLLLMDLLIRGDEESLQKVLGRREAEPEPAPRLSLLFLVGTGYTGEPDLCNWSDIDQERLRAWHQDVTGLLERGLPGCLIQTGYPKGLSEALREGMDGFRAMELYLSALAALEKAGGRGCKAVIELPLDLSNRVTFKFIDPEGEVIVEYPWIMLSHDDPDILEELWERILRDAGIEDIEFKAVEPSGDALH